MFGCFRRPCTLRSKYSSASLPTVITERADSILANLVQGGGLAFLLLACHVVAEGRLGAQLLGGLADGGERQICVTADVHDAGLAGDALAQTPARGAADWPPGQNLAITVGPPLEVLAGLDPRADRHVGQTAHRWPLVVCTRWRPREALWVHVRVHTNGGMGWDAVQARESLDPRKHWSFRSHGGWQGTP